ncbi:hypothetical protein K437DRAFT_258164 [Tilletiaria anomala UBC 951]|uniref:Mitochondrial carrier n=1 Tax=Tilletiaria anomala (strain ATCC 24038 / CBS 436.72 / UBC 951) TaxID=1037660 RepID=A0A066VIV5_TILAU|nr:uncharacterized protein K437DRAFT_258164 [Tilletiaria anomala UBC 951]KDN41677.1 hypothetical protein K437DRAFT_258164 [Tilletiaria anomala UBC 951]
MASLPSQPAGAQPSLAVVGLQLASGIALTYPLQVADTVFKVTYQPLSGTTVGKHIYYQNTLQAANGLIQRDGYIGLLRGVVPFFGYTVLYSSGFETFYQLYRRLPLQSTPLGFVAAQDFALAAWRAVLSPLSTLITRLIVRPTAYAQLATSSDSSSSSTLATLGAADPRAFWNATTDAAERAAPYKLFKPAVMVLELLASLTGNIANSLVSVPITEIFIALAGTGAGRGISRLSKDEWKTIGTLASVAAAGIAVRFVNVALETISKRLQAQQSSEDSSVIDGVKEAALSAAGAASSALVVLRPKPYSGPIDAFNRILNEEGYRGLFHGWGVQIGGTAAVAAATVGLARFNGRI